MFSPKITRHDNGDGTTTVTTITYKIDGTKVVKRKTEATPPPHDPELPENVNRSNRNSVHTVSSLEGVKHVLQEVLGKAHLDNANFHSAVNRAIPAEFILLASQDDVTQAQEDYFAAQHFGLPDHRYGKAGSVATCALLQLMNENPKRMVGTGTSSDRPIDCRQLIHEIKTRVHEKARVEAKPTITSSRPLGPPALKNNTYAPFYIVPPKFYGKRRALLIGCSSGDGEEDLKGPPNDIANIQDFLMNHCGFKHEDIVILRDDAHVTGNVQKSTKQNILDGFANLVKLSKPGDVCFVQYSGHGGRLGDNLCIFPCDYNKNGHILDDDILLDLVKHMPAQVHTTMLVDCCYSGVIGDLPYTLHHHTQDGDPQRIGTYYDTNTRQEVIKNKEEPTKEYLAKKEARSKWKNVTRLGSIAATYAQEFAKEVEKGSSAFAEQARVIVDRKTKEMRESANSMRHSATQTSANLRRSKTQPVGPPGEDAPSPPKAKPASKPGPLRRVQSTATPATMKPASKPQTLRRTKTVHEAQSTPAEKAKPKAAPRSIPRTNNRSPPRSIPRMTNRSPPRRVKTDLDYAREAEEAARKASIGRKEAVAQLPRRTKSMEDAAFEAEEAARRAAVGKRETVSQPRKEQPRRTKSMEDAAFEADEAARRAAVGKKERVEQTAPRKNRSFKEDDEAARKAAVEKSREEAALARAHLEEEKARKEAVERSRREKEELSSRKAEDAARKEAVERSKREAAAARHYN